MMIIYVYIINVYSKSGEDDDVDWMGSVPRILGDEHPVLLKGPKGEYKLLSNENHNLAITRSSSSHAHPGLRVALKYLNI